MFITANLNFVIGLPEHIQSDPNLLCWLYYIILFSRKQEQIAHKNNHWQTFAGNTIYLQFLSSVNAGRSATFQFLVKLYGL